MPNKSTNFAKVIELEDDKLLLISVVNEKQLEAVYEVFEPLSRSWRGQFQAFAKVLVAAYNSWKDK